MSISSVLSTLILWGRGAKHARCFFKVFGYYVHLLSKNIAGLAVHGGNGAVEIRAFLFFDLLSSLQPLGVMATNPSGFCGQMFRGTVSARSQGQADTDKAPSSRSGGSPRPEQEGSRQQSHRTTIHMHPLMYVFSAAAATASLEEGFHVNV